MMGNEQRVFEWRRFGHWKRSAEKARFAAFVLWEMLDGSRLEKVVRECAYTGGDAHLAVIEAFRRESAVALELIVKAVIARKLQWGGADPKTDGVPATHDVPKLWLDAGLPELSREDRYRLFIFKSVLMWSGRYPTPKSPKVWEAENNAFDELEDPPAEAGKFIFRQSITIGWLEFDRLFQIAHAAAVAELGPRLLD
jgi:hypothetical protein